MLLCQMFQWFDCFCERMNISQKHLEAQHHRHQYFELEQRQHFQGLRISFQYLQTPAPKTITPIRASLRLNQQG